MAEPAPHHHLPPHPPHQAPQADRRDFLTKAAAIVIGGGLALVAPVAGLVVFLDPLRRKSEAGAAVLVGSLAAYGLSRFDYKFGSWRNKDISFFFLSQLILPPVVLAMPFLILYKGLGLLDTRIGLILVYTLMVLPIVIWVMRDQFDTIPNELEQAALVDGCSIWGAFFRIILPISLPGMVAAFILSLVLCWNEYFFASLLTGFDAQTLPVMVASQTGSQGINWWTMAALSTAAIAPLVLIGIFLERYIIMGLTAGSGK